MQELDLWSETNIINPLLCNDDDADEYVGEERIEQIQESHPGESPGELPQRPDGRPPPGRGSREALKHKRGESLTDSPHLLCFLHH